MRDRSHWQSRKITFADDKPPDVSHLTPGERLALVDETTAAARAFQTGSSDEPRLRRDVERVIRRGR